MKRLVDFGKNYRSEAVETVALNRIGFEVKSHNFVTAMRPSFFDRLSLLDKFALSCWVLFLGFPVALVATMLITAFSRGF